MNSTQNKLQWFAIACTALGLLTSTYYNAYILKAARMDNELSSYLKLNEHYNRLLFTLLNNDREIFRRRDDASLNSNKYILYELIELLSTVKSLENYYQELDKDVIAVWNRRIEFLLTKPATQHAWQSRKQYAERIYKPEFVEFVDEIIRNQADASPDENPDWSSAQP